MGMPRRQKGRKKFRFHVKRKRLSQKTSKMTTPMECIDVKKEWDNKLSAKLNMTNMGLVYNINETIGIPKVQLATEEEVQNEPIQNLPKKGHVVKAIEDDAKAPRAKLFRLPKSQVEWITYLMDKYGEDYKAMERDRKNYYQETWKQLRAKVNRFKSVPEQYEAYLKSKEPMETG